MSQEWRVDPAALAAEPLTVQELRSCGRRDDARSSKAIDGFDEERFCAAIVGYECPAEALDSDCPVGAAGGRRYRELVDRSPREIRLFAANGCLHELW